jgi:hypothetical protein
MLITYWKSRQKISDPIVSHDRVIPVKRPSLFKKSPFWVWTLAPLSFLAVNPFIPPGSTRNSTRQKVSIGNANKWCFLNDSQVTWKKNLAQRRGFQCMDGYIDKYVLSKRTSGIFFPYWYSNIRLIGTSRPKLSMCRNYKTIKGKWII